MDTPYIIERSFKFTVHDINSLVVQNTIANTGREREREKQRETDRQTDGRTDGRAIRIRNARLSFPLR